MEVFANPQCSRELPSALALLWLPLAYLLFHFGSWGLQPGLLARVAIPAVLQVQDGPQLLSFQLVVLWEDVPRRNRKLLGPLRAQAPPKLPWL